MKIRDRIKELRRVKASDLRAEDAGLTPIPEDR